MAPDMRNHEDPGPEFIEVLAAFSRGTVKPALIIWRRRRFRVREVVTGLPGGGEEVLRFRVAVEEELSPWSEKSAFRPPMNGLRGRGRDLPGGADGGGRLVGLSFDRRALAWRLEPGPDFD